MQPPEYVVISHLILQFLSELGKLVFLPFVDVVVQLLGGEVGKIDVGKHLRGLIGGCGRELVLMPSFEGCIYFCSFVLIVDVVPKLEGDATKEAANVGSDVTQDCLVVVRHFIACVVATLAKVR